MINLVTTNSYFNIFEQLIHSLSQKQNGIDNKKIIFCEEKVSLMIERMIASKLKGSFYTEVYSFGNFLRAKKGMTNLLTKEGSAMVVKNILSTVKLNCFKASKENIAQTLYDLIIQLKSAKIVPADLLNAIENTDGVLKNKLTDIYAMYNGYEQFVKQNGFEDQSSVLSYLPEVIENTDYIENASVYLVGFSGFTAQLRSAVNTLLAKCNDVTAILCEGENPLVFVNETADYIKSVAKENGYPIIYNFVESEYNASAKAIIDNIFNPFADKKNSHTLPSVSNVYCSPLPNKITEVERIAQIIKTLVMSGQCRYRDITIAMSDESYGEYIKNVFANLEIPFFLDQRKKPFHHPLIKLVTAYIDVFRKNFERKSVLAFIKNPFFCQDKKITDSLENYIFKYNLNYNRLKDLFTLNSQLDVQNETGLNLKDVIDKFEMVFARFDIYKMLEVLKVENLAKDFTIDLENANSKEESAVNSQIYNSISSLLSQMQMLLGQVNLSFNEYRNVFLSGVSAIELSIIPQYNDAVFIGDYKQTALVKTEHLFAIGLTSAVPNIQADVSLLSNKDIEQLEQIKILVEPKINIVNHRIRENVALALSAFNKNLYLSYPVASENGTKNLKSEVILTISKLLNLTPFAEPDGYLTKKQGLKTFAKECGEFADGKITQFTLASSYYQAVKSDFVKDLVCRSNKEIKKQLDNSREILIGSEVSPTTIENYYKCPYKLFLSHAIKLKEREEGSVDVLSVGNLMHEIFYLFAQEISSVTDFESFKALFEKSKEKVLKRQEYKKFLLDSTNKATIKRVLNECEKYCYRTYLALCNSKFKVKSLEKAFGDGKDYPAIKLLDGKVKIKGKIDRVDESQNYFRVIDYKTGSADSTDKGLFSGTKLQLYLYGKAVADKYSNGEKQVAGLYYLPVSDKYRDEDKEVSPMADGRTLNDTEAITEQDDRFYINGVSEFLPTTLDSKGNIKNATEKADLQKLVDYAVCVSELATSQLKEGYIVASPYGNACEYCAYKGLCTNEKREERKIGSVSSQTIIDAFSDHNAVQVEEQEWP